MKALANVFKHSNVLYFFIFLLFSILTFVGKCLVLSVTYDRAIFAVYCLNKDPIINKKIGFL